MDGMNGVVGASRQAHLRTPWPGSRLADGGAVGPVGPERARFSRDDSNCLLSRFKGEFRNKLILQLGRARDPGKLIGEGAALGLPSRLNRGGYIDVLPPALRRRR